MPGLITSKSYPFVDRMKSEYDMKRMGEMEAQTIGGKKHMIPKDGRYFFDKNKRVTYKLKNGSKLSPYWYRWVLNTPARLSTIQMVKGYEFVRKTDEIVPEGLNVNAEGHYQYVDLILMRRSLEEYLMERLAAAKIPGQQMRSAVKKFKQEAHRFAPDMGSEAFEAELAKMLGPMDDID